MSGVAPNEASSSLQCRSCGKLGRAVCQGSYIPTLTKTKAINTQVGQLVWWCSVPKELHTNIHFYQSYEHTAEVGQ